MSEQKDLEGKSVPEPKVSVSRESKEYEIYAADHLVLKCAEGAVEKLLEKVAKKKDNFEKGLLKWNWIQAKAKVNVSGRLSPGVWDTETQELFEEIFGGS